MNDLIARIHDAVLGDHVVLSAVVLGAVTAGIVLVHSRRWSSLATGAAVGLALALASSMVMDRGFSGTQLRTRYGFPHWYAVSNWDPETHQVIRRQPGVDYISDGSFEVGNVRVYAAALIGDAIIWCELATILAALAGSRKRGQSRVARSSM